MNEQWDIVSGVGLTALGMAGARAMETNRPDALITDPFAESFVAAAGSSTAIPTRLDGADTTPIWASMSAYAGARALFFDRCLAQAGADQVVLLAAGLDTRAFRLDWPAGCRVFEIDQPKVLEFKDAVLDGARARCDRVTVATDLREDWPGALRAAGFDPGRATAWLAEGLLQYLPAPVERGLYDSVHELSAPGSRFAADHVGDGAMPAPDDPELDEVREQMGTDVSELWHMEDKETPQRLFADRGWEVAAQPAADVLAGYRREVEGGMIRVLAHTSFLTAHRSRTEPAVRGRHH